MGDIFSFLLNALYSPLSYYSNIWTYELSSQTSYRYRYVSFWWGSSFTENYTFCGIYKNGITMIEKKFSLAYSLYPLKRVCAMRRKLAFNS